MSFGFGSSGASASAAQAAARQPLLSETRTPATVPRPPRPNSSPLSFFSLRSESPVVPPDDISGFDTFPVDFSQHIQLNVHDVHPDIEREVVSQYLIAKSTQPNTSPDPEVIYERLEIPLKTLYPDKSVKELKRSIVRVLDEIFFYTQGCSEFQVNTHISKLALLEQETAALASEEAKLKWHHKVKRTFKESTEEKMNREAEEAKQIRRSEDRRHETGLLQRRIPYCEQLKPRLMANSLLSKFNANDARECAFVKFCRDTYPNPNQNEFCGRATITHDDVAIGVIIKIPVPDKIKFELVISGNGSNSDTTSVLLTRFCKFSSPEKDDYLPFDQYYQNDVSRAREIKEDVKNALFNQFREQLRGAPDVETHGLLITALQPKQCATAGENDHLAQEQNSCCGITFCNQQGGAKKIKRTRQSKKKKARRSKSKSKRVRRKNKSRRN
jgi:hypothetical protein